MKILQWGVLKYNPPGSNYTIITRELLCYLTTLWLAKNSKYNIWVGDCGPPRNKPDTYECIKLLTSYCCCTLFVVRRVRSVHGSQQLKATDRLYDVANLNLLQRRVDGKSHVPRTMHPFPRCPVSRLLGWHNNLCQCVVRRRRRSRITTTTVSTEAETRSGLLGAIR